ncbi:MAG: hypothetical protein AABY91_00955, partial [Gemmatimonadota bacterium]
MTLTGLLDAFGATPAAGRILGQLPGRGQQLALGGLPGSSPVLLVAWLAEQRPDRLITVVAATPADADRW